MRRARGRGTFAVPAGGGEKEAQVEQRTEKEVTQEEIREAEQYLRGYMKDCRVSRMTALRCAYTADAGPRLLRGFNELRRQANLEPIKVTSWDT